MNLPKDLGLVGVQENIALTIFFVPYILFEIPSNILMKRFRPHIWRMLIVPSILLTSTPDKLQYPHVLPHLVS